MPAFLSIIALSIVASGFEYSIDLNMLEDLINIIIMHVSFRNIQYRNRHGESCENALAWPG